MNRIPNESTVWEIVRCCELDEAFPFERRFTDEELLRLQTGPRHGSGTPCWTWIMCGNILQVYHRFYNNGKWVQVCLFDVEVNADGSVHSIVIHRYRRDESTQQHERRLRELRSISGPLLDRWVGRYRLYEYSNSSGVFSCDEFGNLIHFDPAEENKLTADTTMQFDWTGQNKPRNNSRYGLSLDRLEIPEGVRSIGSVVDIYSVDYSPIMKPFIFRYTYIPGALVIPRSLKVLNAFAFSDCVINEVIIPGTVCALAQYSFGDCVIRTFTLGERNIVPDIEGEELPLYSSRNEKLNLWRVGRETKATWIGHLRVHTDLLAHGCTVECYNENHMVSRNGCRYCKALVDTELRYLFNEAIIAEVSIFS